MPDAERTVKVRSSKGRRGHQRPDVTDQGLLLRSSEDGFVTQWDSDNIVTHLTEKLGLARDDAEKVARRVERQVTDLGMEVVDSELVRELVNSNLVNMGYHGRLKDLSVYQVSREFIESLLYDKSNENSNIVNNNPEAINLAIAELTLKQWALDAVFSEDVKRAHDTGAIHLHDLGYPTRVYAFSGDETDVTVKIDGVEQTVSLYELWLCIDSPEEKLNETQWRKAVNGRIQVKDRGEWTTVEQLVLSKERKPSRRFLLPKGMWHTVTDEHGVIVKRDKQFIIVRADEVNPETDKLVRQRRAN